MLTSLKQLNLRRNCTKKLYHDIGNCTSIQILDAGLNNISEVAKEIGLMSNLQELYLPRNLLRTVPTELGSCDNLMVVDLSYNKVEGTLPDTLGTLKILRRLDVSFNNVSGLPESVIGLQKVSNAMLMYWKIVCMYKENVSALIESNTDCGRTVLNQFTA
jgi:Leucine-rich repeat (LRR) protein